MGFRLEGILRWDRVLAQGYVKGKESNGRNLPPGANADDLGSDSAMHSLCWDDWEQGTRDAVQAMMDR